MISVVLAIYNEEENIHELMRRLETVLSMINESYEVIFVDDGSTDNTVPIIEERHLVDPRIKLIELSRNFGQYTALRAGIEHALGDTVIIMDADLQDRPEEIPRLIAKMNEGYDVVYAKRVRRQHAAWRRVGSRLLNSLLRVLVKDTDVPKGEAVMLTGIFRAMNKKVARVLKDMPEHTVYIQALVRWVGFKQTYVDVEHDARAHGRTKYNFGKLLRLAIDGIVSFSYFPLRIIIFFGFSIALVSFIGAIVYLLIWLFGDVGAPGFTTLILTILFFGGMQMFLFGIVSEYIGRIYTETKHRPLYIVKRKLL